MLLNSQTKSATKVIVVILFVLVFVTGCQRAERTDISCIVFDIINHEEEDIDTASDMLLRSIDSHNETYRALCAN